MIDVLVVGAGPAGRAVAVACAARGLRTAVLDPEPTRPWRSTYGLWHDTLPPELPDAVVGSVARAYADVLSAAAASPARPARSPL